MSIEAPQIGSEDYNAQMADKFRNQPAPTDDLPEAPPALEIPEGGLEKFYNTETGTYDWQNHAKELDYRLNGKPAEKDALSEPEAVEEQAEVNDIVTSAGLDPAELQTQLQTNGTLSEEAFAALAKVGLSKELVDTYVENFVFRQEAQINEATNYAGGPEGWEQLSNWAVNNMPEQEVARYNELLGTGEWKVAIDALRARQTSSTGEPQLLNGSGITGTGTSGYRSKSEMKVDMSNPKYSTDPAFRQDVMRKMQSATWDLE
jgi:hypothetical protein|tara:strand:+ start:2805 stop:3587 length:783 start_codon:yes stop_codon:yes gene_type:complete